MTDRIPFGSTINHEQIFSPLDTFATLIGYIEFKAKDPALRVVDLSFLGDADIVSPVITASLNGQFQPNEACAGNWTGARFFRPSTDDWTSKPCATRQPNPRRAAASALM